jgi:hypothetical protein
MEGTTFSTMKPEKSANDIFWLLPEAAVDVADPGAARPADL